MSKKSFLTALCAVSLCAILLFSGTNLSEGIRRGLFLCSYSVIPALFPFMALSVFICRSSAAEFFSKLFRPITKLLKIPENCGGILLAAAIGGYPAAAKCINDSVCGGFLDRKTASRMLCFCVNAGPPFLISAVGIGVFGSIRTGFLLFAAQFLSSAIIAVLLSCFSKKPETCREHYSTIYRSNSALIVESIISAAESCFRMCAFIVIACGVLEISFGGAVFGFAENKPLLKAIFSGFFEVTAGVFSCAEIEGLASVIAAGAIASFSGISVILQVAAVTEESKIPLFSFIISRFFHAGLTAFLLRIFLLLSGETAEVFSAMGGKAEAILSASAPAAVSLLCMAALFLLSVVPAKSEKEPVFDRIFRKQKATRAQK